VVSLWYDVSLHIAATNAFVPIRDLHAHLARPGHIGSSLLEDKRLPSELQPYLQSMPLELLKPLVLAAGFSDAGSKSEILARVCAPRPAASSVTTSASSSSHSSTFVFPPSEMAWMTVNELKVELKKLGLRTSGTKQELMERLEHGRAKSLNYSKAKNDVREFVGASGDACRPDVPAVNGFYRSTFNLVDRFNQRLAQLSYLPRISGEVQRIVVSLLQFAVASTYAVCEDNHLRDPAYPPVAATLHKFAEELSDSIMHSEKPFLTTLSED